VARSSEKLTLKGAAGAIEAQLDRPERETPLGVAVVAHPHPLYGGAMDNKVVQTLARAFNELGYAAVRANFRGVGASEGVHDHGAGETDDLVAVCEWALAQFGAAKVALAGFSFGAFVQTRVAARVPAERLVLVGIPNGLIQGARSYSPEPVPEDTLVIHGEQDQTVPLERVFEWARPQELPVVVIPGADHFFHRRLHIIRRIVKGHWHGAASTGAEGD
jgi:alpha/beta superfamily hydrolase